MSTPPSANGTQRQNDITQVKRQYPQRSPPTLPDPHPACLFSFGVLSDCQYADLDVRTNFSGTELRYYRNALNQAKHCVKIFSQQQRDGKLSFVLNFGDLIDGFNRTDCGEAVAEKALQRAMNALKGVELEEEKVPEQQENHTVEATGPSGKRAVSLMNCTRSELGRGTNELVLTVPVASFVVQGRVI